MYSSGVSIILPTYNRGKIINKSILSVLEQSYINWELIVVDDGSVDDTEKIINNFEDSRIKYFKTKSNNGVSKARNIGIKMAKYNYIAFQDSDDQWKKDKLQKQVDYLESHPEYGMVYSKFKRYYQNGVKCVVPDKQIGEREGDLFGTLLINNVVGTPTIMVRKTVLDEVGYFDENITALEDWELVLRISEKSRIGYIPEILVDAYQTTGSISYDGTGYYETRCKMLAKYNGIMQKSGLFDIVVNNLFLEAQEQNVLDPVKQLLLKYIELFNTKGIK